MRRRRIDQLAEGVAPPRLCILRAHRDRYLTLVLQALALRDAPGLPARPLDAAELEQPWGEMQWAGWG